MLKKIHFLLFYSFIRKCPCNAPCCKVAIYIKGTVLFELTIRRGTTVKFYQRYVPTDRVINAEPEENLPEIPISNLRHERNRVGKLKLMKQLKSLSLMCI